ncbi:hypothetical protein QGN29_12545 [Temperatibacter marinus]|uniref:OmpH family outer membrane protein n=1 Tax=Temperatibacter marinus TaxID=1456591 RepID=A0AA52H907_9PROT|nr:hypothetical protein [Temperatibacter marinus]WND02379.1 hypothetical protein QGN29_12545 [Temperatibacter marinus]
MNKIMKTLKLSFAALISALLLAGASHAQILILDGQRIQNEAEAYKDLLSKTAAMRDQITTLNNYVDQRQGGWINEAKEIESKKAITGQKKYEEDMKALDTKVKTAARNLMILRSRYESILTEANREIDRAIKPITTALLKKYKAQIILYKGTVIRHAAGIDKTTEMIEDLNNSLPAVSISMTRPAANNNAPAADAKKDAEKK